MEPFQEYMDEYKKQMQKGIIPEAYKGLMEYLLKLKNHFKKRHPDYFVSSNMYQGYMDMSYFSFTPETMKQRKLRIAIVFIHKSCQFEIWLGGINKQVQKKYWELFKEKMENKYPLVSTIKNEDAIVKHQLVNKPDFNKLDDLTKQIETETLSFIDHIEQFLSE